MARDRAPNPSAARRLRDREGARFMYEWVKKIHMYAGLLSFMAFAVWGIAGIQSAFLPPPQGYQPPDIAHETEFTFEGAGDLDDRELAQRIFRASEVRMGGGVYNVRRNEDGNLAFLLFTWNGRRDFTYLEDQKLVRVAFRNNNLASFLSSMHTAFSRRHPPELPAQLWGYYNEFSTWAFLFMTISGVYMWIATRPRLPWARICVGSATAVAGILWVVTR
jgi:hypothetical protein